jgi:hypothetical protein
LEPGSSGNVNAQLINAVEGLLSLQVRVTNPGPTTGGEFRQIGAVTVADKTRLRNLLLQQLRQRGLAEMQKELVNGEVIVPQTLQIDAILAEDYDQFAGEPAEFLGLEMRALVSAVAYDERDVRTQVFRVLGDAAPEGFRLMNGTQRLAAIELTDVLPDERTVLLKATAEAMGSAVINRGQVHEVIRGKPTDLANLTLAQTLPLATPPDIQLGPQWMEDMGWLERVPWLSLRILVHVEEAAAGRQAVEG